jgi:hypothetical protein
VETFNFLDVGSSSLLAAFVREDFTAQTVITTIGQLLQRLGVPHKLTFDRDPRFVGSASARDFPSAMVRTLLCVGTKTNICPPHRPDLNPFVERYHRSYGQECIRVLGPKDVGQTTDVTEQYLHHYNYERPHQGLSCGNLPPRVAYPELPPLPGLPLWVNPDKWLYAVDGLRFIRKVKSDGMVEVDKRSYGVGRAWAGGYVSLLVDAPSKSFIVMQHQPQAKAQLTALARRHRMLMRAKEAVVVETEAEEVAGSMETLPKKKRPLLLELKAAALEAEARPPLPGELMRLPIKGLHNGAELPFDEFIALMEQEALSEQRRYELARQQRLQKTG